MVPAALQELSTGSVSSAKDANSNALSLPVHGPVLVLLQPGRVGPPAAPSLPFRPPTAAPAGPALPEPLQRPAGSAGAPAYPETWEVTKTQFWTGEPVLDRDRDPVLGCRSFTVKQMMDRFDGEVKDRRATLTSDL